jgi:hypothetical protein
MEAKLMQSTRPASTTSSSQGEDGGWELLSVEDDVESINSSFGEDQVTVGKEQVREEKELRLQRFAEQEEVPRRVAEEKQRERVAEEKRRVLLEDDRVAKERRRRRLEREEQQHPAAAVEQERLLQQQQHQQEVQQNVPTFNIIKQT